MNLNLLFIIILWYAIPVESQVNPGDQPPVVHGNWENLTKEVLVLHCNSRNLKSKGSRQTLIDRLRNHNGEGNLAGNEMMNQ